MEGYDRIQSKPIPLKRFSPLILLLFSCFTSLAVAQNQTRFEIGAHIEWGVTARDLFNHFILSPPNEYQYLSKEKFSVLPSVSVNYRLNSKVALTTGIGLSDFGHRSERTMIPGFSVSEHTYHAYFLSVPAGIRITALDRGIDLKPAISVVADIYLGERSDEPEFELVDAINWKPVSLSSKLSLGIEYPVRNHFSLGLEPYVTLPLNDYAQRQQTMDAIDIKPYRLGISAGLRYRF